MRFYSLVTFQLILRFLHFNNEKILIVTSIVPILKEIF